jgi:hypothetical protein
MRPAIAPEARGASYGSDISRSAGRFPPARYVPLCGARARARSHITSNSVTRIAFLNCVISCLASLELQTVRQLGKVRSSENPTSNQQLDGRAYGLYSLRARSRAKC